MPARRAVCLLLIAGAAWGQRFHAYVGELGPDHVTLAWGTTDGRNTIGRSSPPMGNAEVRIAGRSIAVSDRNWMEAGGLAPDTSYPYELLIGGRPMAHGIVRTWPAKADRLSFLLLGDFGNASSAEYRIAEAMKQEFLKRRDGPDPIRFVLTTGDNIYADFSLLVPRHSGSDDADWETRLYAPFSGILASVPFYPTLGNHDGNESEVQSDLGTWLDNFFFPGGKPARYYRFSFGGLADFFALDSTRNTEQGPPAPAYEPGGEQSKWLNEVLPASKAPWKIPYFHHPPYTAGPFHAPSLSHLRHWVELFEKSGVRVAFSGHEHNFQVSDPARTAGILYVISGSGGELRRGGVRNHMKRAGIAAWTPQNQFLLVEIDGKSMRISPLGFDRVRPVDAAGRDVPLPVTLTLE